MKQTTNRIKEFVHIVSLIFAAIILFYLGVLSLVTIFLGALFEEDSAKGPWIYARNDPSQNVLDEMLANNGRGLREAPYIVRGETDESGLRIELNYKYLPKGTEVGAHGYISYGPGDNLGERNVVMLDFEIGESVEYRLYYSDSLNLLLVENLKLESNMGNGWKDIKNAQRIYYEAQNDIFLERWLKTGKSLFTREDLGEFKLVDNIPYAYTGLPDSKPIERIVEKESKGETAYLVWLDNDRLLCVQREEIFQTLDKERQENCSLKDLLILDNAFYGWLKNSGQAIGNLERIPESMEKGMQNTQLMLQNCPIEEMEKMLPGCEFYLEPGYLHIRFPYWNWDSENPAWERNGDELWRGWLNLKTEDIEGFLKVEKW